MKIAITGGIAEGKSTILGYLSDLGHEVASADALAREVFLDREIQSQIAAASSLDLPIDSAQLRNRIAEQPALRRAINKIMHPEIVLRMSKAEATFFEIPLLIETCRYFDFDEIWVVTCGREEQRRRLTARYGKSVQIESILSTQIDSRAKIAFADRVFRTNEPPEAVRQMVSEATASIFRS